jgi:hypothetical protein
VFCLDDGTRLVRESGEHDANATWNLPPPGPTVASPRPTSPTAQSTLTSRPEPFQHVPRGGDVGRGESRSSALPWIFAIVVVLAVSGVLMAWLISRGGGSDISNSTPPPSNSNMAITRPLGNSNMANVAAPASPTPERKPSPTPERPQATPVPTPREPPPKPKPMFSTLDNMTLTGSRITYYQRTSFAGCQADCAANSSCKAATWIRPGAYNPGDPGMCYLMSAVTGRVPHVCCITALRN